VNEGRSRYQLSDQKLALNFCRRHEIATHDILSSEAWVCVCASVPKCVCVHQYRRVCVYVHQDQSVGVCVCASVTKCVCVYMHQYRSVGLCMCMPNEKAETGLTA